MFSCICMAITAPMNNDMIMVMGMDPTPSLLTSKIVQRPNSFHLSGKWNTRQINIQYRPNVFSELISIIIQRTKVMIFFVTLLPKKK